MDNNTGKNLGKEWTKNSKSFKPTKRKLKKVRKVPQEWKFEIDLENMEPWSPTTDAWESENEKNLSLFGTHEEDVETSSSESDWDTEWEGDDQYDSDGRKMKTAISGSYLYRYNGDESGGDEEDEADFYQYRIPELNLTAFKVKPHEIVGPEGRIFMKKQLLLERSREKQEYSQPRGSYLRCPEGGCHMVDTFTRRLRYGPFLYCPVSHLQCSMFEGFCWKRRKAVGVGLFEVPRFRRPPFRPTQKRFPRYGRGRTDPIILNCKECSRLGFTHHGDPDFHYQDYINFIQFQGSNPEANPQTYHQSTREIIDTWSSFEIGKKAKKAKGKKKAAAAIHLPPPPRRRPIAPVSSRLLNDTFATLNKRKEIVSPPVTSTTPFNAIPFNLYTKYSRVQDKASITTKPPNQSGDNSNKKNGPPIPSTSAQFNKTTKISTPIRPRPVSSSLPTPRPGASVKNTLAPRPLTPFQFSRPNVTLFDGTIASERRKKITLKKSLKKRKPYH